MLEVRILITSVLSLTVYVDKISVYKIEEEINITEEILKLKQILDI